MPCIGHALWWALTFKPSSGLLKVDFPHTCPAYAAALTLVKVGAVIWGRPWAWRSYWASYGAWVNARLSAWAWFNAKYPEKTLTPTSASDSI